MLPLIQTHQPTLNLQCLMPTISLEERPPEAAGPKLGPFPFGETKKPQIEVMKFIGEGLHSKVYQVRIEGAVYALKAVSTSDLTPS